MELGRSNIENINFWSLKFRYKFPVKLPWPCAFAGIILQ